MPELFPSSTRKRAAALAVLSVLTLINPLFADGTVSIGTSNIVDFKGWGIFPAPYDRQTPTYQDGSTAYADASWLPTTGAADINSGVGLALKDLSFDIVRAYVSPTIGKSDNTLDSTRLQDLKDHLQTFKNMGITKYTLNAWSPPAYMKSPNPVRYGKYNNTAQTLNPTYADGSGYDYADFLVAVLVNLKNAGFAAPVAVSVQNEPDMAPDYDGAFYDDASKQAVWRSVVKQLRAKMNANGFTSTPIIGSESSGVGNMENFLGTASSAGFAQMNSDTTFRDAIGGFAYHTYFTLDHINTWNQAQNAYVGRDRWMTEYSPYSWFGVRGDLAPYVNDSSVGDEIKWALHDVRRMAGDLVDLKTNYWFWWRGWHSSSSADGEDLLYGNAQKTKAYYVFQKIWQTVDPGWKVKQVSDTDTDLSSDNSAIINSYEGNGAMMSLPIDIIAFESGDGTKSCVLLANWKNTSKQITGLSGLKGGNANIYVSSNTQDMAAQAARTVSGGALQGGNLTLPPYSITIVTTGGTGTGPTPTPVPTATPTPSPNPTYGNGTGLTGDYFSTASLTSLVQSRTDSQIYFDWGTGSPMACVGPDNFSVRWTGQIQAVEGGNYTITTNTDDGLRLWLGNTSGTPLIDKWVNQAPTQWSSSMPLTAGQKYNFKMEYYDSGGGALAQLYWTRPSGAFEVVPQSQLYPTTTSSAGPNLVTNPGFETDAATQTPTGWSTWTPSGSQAADFTETTGGAHGGNYHGTHWLSSGAYQLSTYQIKTGLTNGLYTLRAWVRSSGGQTTAQLYAQSYGGSQVHVDLNTAIGPWTQVSLPNINVTNGQCEVGFYSVAAANQYIYFDDVEFFKQ